MGSQKISITDVRVVPLKNLESVGSIEPAWDKGGSMHFNRGGGSFTEVHTNEGLVGIGPGMEPSIVSSVLVVVNGEDPFEIEKISQRLKYHVSTLPYRGTAGVDIAIWDIIGKATGKPLYKLWGGSKNRMMPYASMILLSHPEERAELAHSLSDDGWKAIKIPLLLRLPLWLRPCCWFLLLLNTFPQSLVYYLELNRRARVPQNPALL